MDTPHFKQPHSGVKILVHSPSFKKDSNEALPTFVPTGMEMNQGAIEAVTDLVKDLI